MMANVLMISCNDRVILPIANLLFEGYSSLKADFLTNRYKKTKAIIYRRIVVMQTVNSRTVFTRVEMTTVPNTRSNNPEVTSIKKNESNATITAKSDISTNCWWYVLAMEAPVTLRKLISRSRATVVLIRIFK